MTSTGPSGVSRPKLLAGLGAGGALVATGGLAACTRILTPTGTQPVPNAAGPQGEFAQAAELASRDGRLDATLVAAAAAVPYAGGTRWALTYIGTTPGSTLRVRPGDEVTMTLENRLDTTTNLHTHGLHVPRRRQRQCVRHGRTRPDPHDHPFHLHVWPFRVVERSDGAALPPGWKDTVKVAAGQAIRIRVPFRDIPGKAVYHCHILDHEDLGMMGIIDTQPS